MIRILALVTLVVLPAAAQEASPADPSRTAASASDPRAAPRLSTQSRGGSAVGFTLRGGVASTPEFFGSDDAEQVPDIGFSLDHLRLGGLSFGDPDPLYQPEGLGVIGSFRYVPERDDADSPVLGGLDDVDAAVELGAGLRYATDGYQVYGAVRYGVVGHESFVGELGADAFLRPSDRLTLRLGPRALFGGDDYVDEYFGVGADEAAASTAGFGEYDPDGGLVSTGVEVGASYRFTDNWGVESTLRYDRLRSDAGASPITQSEEQFSASVGITRRFTFGF